MDDVRCRGRNRIVRLGLECLEPRDTPAVLAADADNFGNVVVFNTISGVRYLTFRPFDTAANQYIGQMSLALGDVNHDSVPDLIVATRGKRAGKVKVFDGAGIEAGPVTLPTQTIFTTFPIAGYNQGLTVAAADANGDGITDIIAAGRRDPANGNAATVVVYSGANTGTGGAVGASLIGAFQPFNSTFAGGVYVAARNTGTGGRAEIAVSSSNSSDIQFWQFGGAAFGQIIGDVAPFGGAAFVPAAGDGQIAALDVNGAAEFVTGHLSGGVTTFVLLTASGGALAAYSEGAGASFFAIDALALIQGGNELLMFAPVTPAGGTTIDLFNSSNGSAVGTLNGYLPLSGKVTVAGS